MEKGLSTIQVNQHLAQYGQNIIAGTPQKLLVHTFLERFKNPLVLLLLFASIISMFTGDPANALVILAIILISVGVDLYQEQKSDQAVSKLKQRVAINTEVLRDGKRQTIPMSLVTVDDIVFLSAGNIVPADLKIITSKDLHVDESTLTGESFPAAKADGDKLLMGTTVINGEVMAKVVMTGKQTEMGKVADRLSQTRPPTNFEKGVKDFGALVVRLALILAVVIFSVNAILHHNLLDSLIFTLALVVGLTPELLPAIVTVNLAQGAIKLAKKGVIVKHLPAIQNLGAMTVLCTDKTGTITENKIILERYENSLTVEDPRVLEFAYVNSAFQSNLKNPLDEAVLAHKEITIGSWKKIDEIPFDFQRKRLSVVADKDTHRWLVCKGAPETVWEVTTAVEENGQIIPLDKKRRDKLKSRFEKLSNDGFRVIAIAYRKLGKKDQKPADKTFESDLIFLGFTAFLDPPKHAVKETLAQFLADGVDLKILTGDNELVTKRICQELDLPVAGTAVGHDLEGLTEKELQTLAKKTTIFARLNPEQKDKIILALKKSGFVVGYLGDGVNDANSLRLADVGISVENAVDVAKESADLILVTKSLQVLQDGILGGRKTFLNTLKYVFMETSSNFGNMLSVSIASVFLPFIPMLPIQILLNNLIYDLSQVAIPTDHVDQEDLKGPVKWDISFIKRFILAFGPVSSVFDLLTFYILLAVFHSSIGFFRTAWFVESLVTQALVIFAIRTKKVPFFKSLPSKFIFISSAIVLLLAIIITQSSVGKFFQFTKLPFIYWIYILVITVLYFSMVEVVKVWFYRSWKKVKA